MSTNNPNRDRKPGEMGLGMNSDVDFSPKDAAKPKETAEGWTSKSFSMPLGSGKDLSDYHADSTQSGPAWPSHSKTD